MIHTVKSTMPTGKEDPKFGKEFYVQFNENEQAFPLWFKEAPAIGKEIDGEVVGGKFKKIKKEWTPNAGGGNATQGAAPAQSKPVYKDNSDGMRQGMCINNAANYVNSIEFRGEDGNLRALTDREWSETVHSYATALYRLGDLTQAEVDVELTNPFKV